MPSPQGLVGFSQGATILWESDADLARDLDGMRELGATWLRLDFPWPSIEPAREQFNWAPFDRIVSAAHVRGFEILGLLSYTPSWAAARGKTMPSNPDDFARFAAA